MSGTPEQQLRAYVEYFRDVGVYEFYRPDAAQWAVPQRWRELIAGAAKRKEGSAATSLDAVLTPARAVAGSTPAAAKRPEPMRANPVAEPAYFNAGLPQELAAPMPKPVSFDVLAPLPAEVVPAAERAAALERVRAEIGDCTRCPLAYAGRHTIVFADGDPNARLMFVGEGPGADEDAQGLPFVGRAGQLLNNMIAAMGLRREDVYIANIVKCRPPGNRTPEFVEASTCSQFLVQQIDIVRPEVIVALGSTAATYLLGVRQSLSSLRGRWHKTRGAKLAVTYHPAFLLRDPRQKSEAWKDLQMVMAELGLKPAPRKTS
ncbi:MAG TPA: uracil-DNA glycosylase [Acidobacteriaceae bacterium]|jgi:DNA polymerase|nr:uracil-DNA glycosylase [Acidobacteriaceae bacterium]